MKLEEITAEIRPRTQWESIDLGVALTRRHFPKLFLLWTITVFPIWALIIFIFRESPIWALLLIAFLDPLYERPLVYYLSRALFNAPPPISEILKRYFKIVWPGLLRGLTIARFSPMRSLLMPLHVLEGACGQQYKKRRVSIVRNGGGTATTLTFICALVILILLLGVIFLTLSFAPKTTTDEVGYLWKMFLQWLFDDMVGDFPQIPSHYLWFLVGAFLVALTLTELFYVGCGFAIYLNSRSHVEGWDIEITFRRLASKLASMQGIVAACLLGALLFICNTSSASADEPAEIKRELAEILEQEEFEVFTEDLRVYQTGDNTSLAGLGVLALLGQFLFIALIAAAVFGLAYAIYANRHLFSGIKSAPKEEEFEKTRTVMGMDVASDTLPDDIPAAALAAWRNGDPQQATSLLYRGAICWLVEAAKLPLIDSDTENDCLQHSSTLDDASRHDYFAKLTSQWVRTAYNDTPPSESDIQQLCSTWPFDLKEVKS